MNKLKLEHLAPYLPYGVAICFKTSNGIKYHTLTIDNIKDVIVYTNNYKPILRPLSDLTKEIEHNGERFVPNVKLNDTRRNIDIYKPLNLDYPLEINIDTENYSQQIDLYDGYLVVQKLLSWHFDIFGLIDKKLAIDINTLNENND